MARQQIKNYVFNPAGAGVGTVILPGNFSNAQIIAILNTTKQQFIYNFADSTLLGTITWNSQPDANFPQSIDGITTLTLTTSTSTMSASDKLAIYVEQQYPTQRPFATDAVERLRSTHGPFDKIGEMTVVESEDCNAIALMERSEEHTS